MADDDAVHLTLQDDGAGRPGPTVPGPSGHGLIGIRERVDLFGGRLDAGPTPCGWRLMAVLPAPLASLRVPERTR